MAESNGYSVPSPNYEVMRKTSDSRWAVSVAYRERDGRAWREITAVTLREMPEGTIQLDTGIRAPGGRPRTGTHDRQEAVDFACERLAAIVGASDGIIDRTTKPQVAAGLLSGFRDHWMPVRSRQAKRKGPRAKNKGVGQHTIRCVRNAVELAVYMGGKDFPMIELVGEGALQDFLDEFVAWRMEDQAIDPAKAKAMGLTIRGKRGVFAATTYNTAIKDARRICEVLRLVSNRPHPLDPEMKVLSPDPTKLPGFLWPQTENNGQGRMPLRWETTAMLMETYTEGDVIMAAPLDQVDPSGRARLIVSILAYQGMRRKTALLLQRKHLALTPAEVGPMIRDHGRYIRPESIPQLTDRLLILHDDTKMSEVDPVHYRRPVPCHPNLAAEIMRYVNRYPELRDADPDAYIFGEPGTARTRPVAENTVYKSNSWIYETDEKGKPRRNGDGSKVIALDENGMPRRTIAGQWIARALNIVRRRIADRGEDWTNLAPAASGQLAHGWRSNLEETLAELGWLQITDIKGLQDESKKLNLTRYVDYVLNRKMEQSERNESYAMLDPELMVGVVDLEYAAEVTLRISKRRTATNAPVFARLAQAAGRA